MRRKTVNDLDVQALVDHELRGDEQTRIMAAVRGDPLLQGRYDQLKAQRRLLRAAMTVFDEDVVLH